MENPQKTYYKEVEQILDILGEDYKQKIPEKIRRLFDTNPKDEIKYDINVEEIPISRQALTIISILNYKYWEKDTDEKEKLKNIYDQNERKYREKINVYQQEDWLRSRTSQAVGTDDGNVGNALILQKDIPIIQKVILFFKKLFHRK